VLANAVMHAGKLDQMQEVQQFKTIMLDHHWKVRAPPMPDRTCTCTFTSTKTFGERASLELHVACQVGVVWQGAGTDCFQQRLLSFPTLLHKGSCAACIQQQVGQGRGGHS
jgi:hypothetical protein